MKKQLLAFGVSLLAMATIGVVQLQTKAVDSSRDCDQYAVIRCGTLNRDELRREFETNNTAGANGYTTEQADIKKIFNAMGITRADLDLRVEQGVVYKDGSVKVGDKTVATDAKMAARGLGGTQIAGTNAQKVSVSAMSDAQTAMVFYKAGKFAFAVMKPCGNPVTATPKEEPKPEPTPVAECVSLKAVARNQTDYELTATAKVSGGAKIESYHFTVTQQGGSKIFDNTYPATGPTQSVVYTGFQPGTYTATVKVKTSEGIKTSQNCTVTITVAKPPVIITETPTPGVDITKFVNTDKKYALVNTNVEFNYTIAVKNTGNVDLDNVVVSDTPDRAITLVSVVPPSGTISNNVFTYTIPKLLKGETRTFVLTAKVPQAQAGRLVNTVCVDAPAVTGNPDKCDKAEVEVPPTPVPGKIEVCLKNENRHVQIFESEFNSAIHSRDFNDCVEAVVPTELPQTGPAETIMSVLGAASMVSAGAYYLASRRQLGV